MFIDTHDDVIIIQNEYAIIKKLNYMKADQFGATNI